MLAGNAPDFKEYFGREFFGRVGQASRLSPSLNIIASFGGHQRVE
jgi:hypothetical protein